MVRFQAANEGFVFFGRRLFALLFSQGIELFHVPSSMPFVYVERVRYASVRAEARIITLGVLKREVHGIQSEILPTKGRGEDMAALPLFPCRKRNQARNTFAVVFLPFAFTNLAGKPVPVDPSDSDIPERYIRHEPFPL